jgi:CARDB
LTAQGGCSGIPGIQFGPCGRETHCEGQVPAEAVYDLFARDLQGEGGLTNYGFNTALEITTRLTGIAADNLASWYECAQGTGGCGTMSGYRAFLAADDDDGNLANGTPHMQAIFNAFNRHGIACATESPTNSGCGGISQIPPTLTVTAGPNSATLSWTAVSGAVKYAIYRTEGVKGCDFGKTPLGSTTGTTFTDTGLRDGFPQLYTVLPLGSNDPLGSPDACLGRMATCQTVTPAAPASETAIAIREVGTSLSIASSGSDNDVYLDNCEQATLTFRVENAGTTTLTNVRITAVEIVGKPASDIITPLPLAVASSLAPSCSASGPLTTIVFRPQGLAFDETVEVKVSVMATELASPLFASVFISGAESSFQAMASKTFTFDTDLEGWKIVSGTYTLTPPGSPASPVGALSSSQFKDAQCDNIQSPEMRLTSSSTLSLQNQFSTEPESLGAYDRANVGVFDVATGARTTIEPDGGREYTYGPGTTGGTCVTENQAGWATGPTSSGIPFLESTWSSTALGLPGNANKRVRIDVGYGTDPLASGAGFQFDHVTITNIDLQVPDQQSNTCAALPPPPKPDLIVTNIVTNNNKSVREGEKVTINATVRNQGNAPAAASQAEFRVDNTILGLVATPSLAANTSAPISIQWDTRSQKGTRTIRVTADAGLVVNESSETNNSSTTTVNVQGNKVKNQSFEQGGGSEPSGGAGTMSAESQSASGPAYWSGSSTGAGSATWSDGGSDGAKSAGASGNGGNAATSGSPTWTSDPIAVTPGEVLAFTASVSAANASSAATAGLVYLGAAGNVLQTVNLLTAPLTTAGFTKLEQAVTIPAGVTQVRVKLVGFAPTDRRTSGIVRFDEIGLYGN